MKKANLIALSALAALGIVACGNGDAVTSGGDESAVAENEPVAGLKPTPVFDGTVSKPGSPFIISYDIVGTPIVGSPVTVNLRVTTTLGPQPVKVSYRISDASAMMFHEAQPAEVEVLPAANEEFIAQQVTVIPQREGRLYLNVGAAVETDEGSISSVIAVPIQVGEGARVIEEQGEVQTDENGEAIRVLTPD